MEARILEAQVEFVPQPFSTPLMLSSGPITQCTQAIATVTVEVTGQRATGRGAIALSYVWAWPSATLSGDRRDSVLRQYCTRLAGELKNACGSAAHPLELGMRLHDAVAADKAAEPPTLARVMCASPFDAAIHDAVGIALGRSAFALYDRPFDAPTADACFEGGLASERIARLIAPPKRQLKAWYIVGKNDTPETVRPWVVDRGFRYFKIKTLGKDSAQDAARTVEVSRLAQELGVKSPVISIDANEGNPDADSVLDYLLRLRAADAQAFDSVQYLEQPTTREIIARPYDWHKVAALKPVVLDEGLTGQELFATAVEQGWSGFAVKTCKGQSFSLVAAAWAKEHGLLVALQDLTNPGLAAIHSALFAAHVPTINDIELNSPQFAPVANEPFLPQLAGLFQPTGGVHRLPQPVPVGLGSGL